MSTAILMYTHYLPLPRLCLPLSRKYHFLCEVSINYFSCSQLDPRELLGLLRVGRWVKEGPSFKLDLNE